MTTTKPRNPRNPRKGTVGTHSVDSAGSAGRPVARIVPDGIGDRQVGRDEKRIADGRRAIGMLGQGDDAGVVCDPAIELGGRAVDGAGNHQFGIGDSPWSGFMVDVGRGERSR